jgi:hypothetical protein
MHLRTGVEGVSKQAPALPSDKDHSFTYGKPAAYRCGRVMVSGSAHLLCAACMLSTVCAAPAAVAVKAIVNCHCTQQHGRPTQSVLHVVLTLA